LRSAGTRSTFVLFTATYVGHQCKRNTFLSIRSSFGNANAPHCYNLLHCMLCLVRGMPYLLWGRERNYRSADESLARPGRKQATVTEDFNVHISYL